MILQNIHIYFGAMAVFFMASIICQANKKPEKIVADDEYLKKIEHKENMLFAKTIIYHLICVIIWIFT
jgi:hypothetical protein